MTSRFLSVGLLITGSGFCALTYQIVWMRELRLVFGASTAATAAVTAVFMGGLGVGSAILGRRADRIGRPMKLYSGLEALISGLALVSPLLIILGRHLYMAAGGTAAMGAVGGTVARLLISGVILGGATVAMGGTLPAVVRAFETHSDVDRRGTAFLYGMNTLGAVAGVLAATFWMVEIFGLRNTLTIAALINLLVAAAAWQIACRMPEVPASAPVFSPPAPAPAPGADGARDAGRTPAWGVYLAAFTTGFVFFLMELVWYRMMAPVLGGTTYSFGMILAVALLGIGVGGGLYAAVGSARIDKAALFAVTCAIEALLLAVPFFLGDWVAILAGLSQPLKVLGLKGQMLSWASVTCVAVFPASVMAGYQFPLLIALLGQGADDVGRHTGNAYAFNTAGAIAGALAGGFGLMTVLSAPGCWRLAVILLLMLSLSMTFFLRGPRAVSKKAAAAAAAAALTVMLFAVSGPTAAWRHTAIGAGRLSLMGKDANEIRDVMAHARRNVFWQMDGKESAIGMDRANGYAFIVNGKIDGNAIGDAATQVMGGLIGTALHPRPERALVIGLGTGSTAGWLAKVPSMTRVDVVEIEPGIVEVARFCAPVNQNVLGNPKVDIRFGDAREYLMTTDQIYDVIFSEPSNPYRAGIASLYTVEFYREAAKRLGDGGMFMQWVQAYEIAPRTMRSIYVTLSQVFPYIDTWETQTNDLVLVGTLQPIRMDRAMLAPRLAGAPYAEALRNTWHAVGVEGFLSHFMANGRFAAMLSRTDRPEWWLNTDDRMQIEFDFARTLGDRQLNPTPEMQALARQRGDHRPAIDPAAVDWDRVDADGYISRIMNTGLDAEPANSSDAQVGRMKAFRWFVQKRFDAVRDLMTDGRFTPVTPIDHLVSGMALATAADARVLGAIPELRRSRPVDAEAILTLFHWHRNDPSAARAHLERTIRRLRVDPWASPYCVIPALDIASKLAGRDPDDIDALVDLLRIPFSAGQLTEKRLRLLLRVASMGGYEKGAAAVALFEPHVPWEEGFLKYRRDAYNAVNSPLSARADRDYRRFAEAVQSPMAALIERQR